ncbi:MAG: M20 family metallopeptidase [Patescibacteria group bacterium]
MKEPVIGGARLDEVVEGYRDEIIRTTQELVRLPSENIAPRGYEKDAQNYLIGKLKGIEAEVDVFNPEDVPGLHGHEAYFPGRDYTGRFNVVAVRRGTGGGRSLMFSSHVDVVTPKPLPWRTGDPYSGRLENGRIYGRGSFDMKGGLVATLFVLRILSDLRIPLKGDLYFESVVDEENAGSNGTLAARLRGHNADVTIIPEPSLFDLCPACKGGRYYRVSTSGVAGTGYGGEELANPVYALAPLLSAVEAYEKRINTDVRADPLFAGEAKPRGVILDKVQAGDVEAGGNIGIPDQAWFSVFINTLLDYTDARQLDEEFFSFLDSRIEGDPRFAKRKPEYRAITRYLLPFKSDPNHPVVAAMREGIEHFTRRPARVAGAKFACDGFIFKHYFNSETYVLGPRGGGAHAQDEFVEADDLVQLTKIFLLTALRWCNA